MALSLAGSHSAAVAAADDKVAAAPEFKVPIVPRLQGRVSVDEAASGSCAGADDIFAVLNHLDNRVIIAPPKNKGVVHLAINAGSSLANFILDLRGFDWSKEGADVALDENVKPKGDWAKEYLHRRRVDQLQLQTLASIMQVADGMGAKPTTESKTEIEAATRCLGQCVGAEDAANIVCALADKSDHCRAPQSASTWNLQTRNEKLRVILEATAKRDPVVADLKRRLSKFNHRSKFIQITAKVVYSTLGIASFSPTLVAPIAETAVLAFMMATGGPEQDKLLKEVYLAKCLESRVHLLNEQAHLLVDAYETGVSTSNPLLAECSELLLSHLSSTQICNDVFASPDRTTISSGTDRPGM